MATVGSKRGHETMCLSFLEVEVGLGYPPTYVFDDFLYMGGEASPV